MNLILLGILACPVGCRPGDRSGQPESPGRYIAFVGTGTTDPLWPVLRAGAERYAAAHPYSAVRYLVPDLVSPEAQVKLIRGLLGDLSLRGICIQVTDPESLTGVLEEAAVHGVPVVAMMRDVPAHLRNGFCGIDEKDIGRQLARAAAEAAGGRGNIMVLISDHQAPDYAQRLDAFKKEIAKASDIHVLAYVECQGNLVRARRETRENTLRYPSIGAWVMLDVWAFAGWTAAPRLLPEGCPIVTVNPFPVHWKRLESGECFALVGGEYGRIGHEAIRYCEMAIGSQLIHRMESLVPADVVRASELAAYRSKWILWSSPLADIPPAAPARGSS